MSNIRKLFAFLLIFSLILSTIACSASDSSISANVQKSSADNSSEFTLSIAARNDSYGEIIKKVCPTFEQEYNCNIEINTFDNNDLYNEIIDNVSNEISKYDIIMIDDPLMPEYIEKNVLCNLTKLGYEDDEDFVEKSRLLGKHPYPLGATYALPFSGNVQLLFYNKNLIGNNSDLSSWKSVLNYCQFANINGKNGFAVRGQTGNPIVSDFLPILWAYGGDIFNDSFDVILDSEQSRSALELYYDLYETGDNYDKEGMIEAIKSGEAAICLGWPAWFVYDASENIGVVEVPLQKDSTSVSYASGEIGNWLLGITDNSENKELSLTLLKFLTSESVQKQAVEFGGIPTRKSVFHDSEIIESYPFLQTVYAGTNNSRVRPRTSKWSKIENAFGKELVKYLNNEQSVDETIAKSQDAIERLMED